MKYTGMSAREVALSDEVERRGLTVFGPLEAAKILGVDRETAHLMLSRLRSKGAAVRIERGKYITRRSYSELDAYEIAPHVFEPSYISMWSGLHYYGYTTQVPGEVFLVTTRARRGFEVQGMKARCVTVKPRMFFGYRSEGRAVVAEPEKLLIDCLAFPEHSGGFGEILGAARAAALDARKIVEYASSIGSPTICSRLGYLLEQAGVRFDQRKLLAKRSRSYVWLDPSATSKRLSNERKWRLYINAEAPG